MEIFRHLLNRDDLPPQCLACNTSFSMGKLYLSVVTFRETEFEESPVIPLLYMVHEEQTEAAYAFLFLRLNHLAPELLLPPSSDNPGGRCVIYTNGEEVVVNALLRTLPCVPRFRCWHQAYRGIKSHLRSLGVVQREKLLEYKDDFIKLLSKRSQTDYTYALVDMVLKWNKVIDSACSFCFPVFLLLFLLGVFNLLPHSHRSGHEVHGGLGSRTLRTGTRFD